MMRGAWVVLVSFAACAPPFQPGRPYTGSHADAPPVPDTLTVVSYNVQYGEDITGALADLTRHRRLREAGIVCLQEMQPDGVERIAGELGYDYVYYAAAISPHHGKLFGNAVLSRWPIVDHGLVRLPRGGTHTGTQRVAVVAELDLGSERIHVVSLHTATPLLRWPRRLVQMQVALDSVAALPGPIIVAGDFNTVTRNEVTRSRRLFRRAGFQSAHLPPGRTAKPKLFARLTGLTPLRLDHVYFRGYTWAGSSIVTDTVASDHLPIWVRLVRN
jgi:endonuclease/exonuclease/phosphatase family metal-dependent hydrolase